MTTRNYGVPVQLHDVVEAYRLDRYDNFCPADAVSIYAAL